MEERLSNKKTYTYRKMDFYVDRGQRADAIDVADKCAEGILHLWDKFYLDSNNCKGNVFCHQFEGSDVISQKEYLFAMDYLTCVLTAYRRTGKEIYKDTFEKYINQFYDYLKMNEPFYEALSVYSQILLFIKSLDVLECIPHQKFFCELLRKYSYWLVDTSNYENYDNHGMFQNIALLHLSVLFESEAEASFWQRCAIERIQRLFQDTYYNDFTNNENSILYFEYNNFLYEEAIQFCRYYNISGLMEIEKKLELAKAAFITLAHRDGSMPLIGDGRTLQIAGSNNKSQLFADIGIAVLKVEETYLSFKNRTIYQFHAHIDVSSITARYKHIDFLMDTGQYNYDRYTPINRYVRSATGHSGIFPLYADNLFQKEFCDSLQYSNITAYEENEEKAFVKGEYKLNDVSVCREISVFAHEIVVRDSWQCEKPTTMRQRFVIPKTMIENANFTVSRRTLETAVDKVRFRFEISSDLPDALTVVQFGIAAPDYYAYEETMLLDTFAENTLSGKITARITFEEEES